MSDRKKITLPTLYEKHQKGEPITMLTCYDYPTAFLQEEADVEMILVGDSLGMTILGYESTLPVTMEDMIRHAQAVRRGAPTAWLIGDMPYMTYQPSVETAIRNAGRFMAEAACDAVKLEGGREMADRMAGIVAAGIPCMGHLGLTPQSASSLGGFRVQGRDAARAARIVEDAAILEEAGAYSILLEMVPDRVCHMITDRANIPIISLGSGPDADGQLLIFHDMFGLYPRFKPKMAKVYGNAGEVILNGVRKYVEEVQNRSFPQPENWFSMKDDVYGELLKYLEDTSTKDDD
ncbi:MAG TPA: 3-methyl-2-oxobutanoate hydroxymethyltransferase [Aggregatilineaceae bacterium]|jgi:3-methyl-2-oxobutanoate hydroxymethyltransferase|nr:3-methyl-2-oxobutanoate hydroxymethyltransferase [Aggregatilineaceae bacterium]